MLNILLFLESLGFAKENVAGIIGFIALFIGYVLLKKDIGHIKENLSNHITDTNKKIDEVKAGQEKLRAEVKADYNEVKAGQEKLRTEITGKIDTLTTTLLSNKVQFKPPTSKE